MRVLCALLADPCDLPGHPEAVAVLSVDSLQLKDGCAVVLHWDDAKGGFVGATGAKSCPSDLRGAFLCYFGGGVVLNSCLELGSGF